MLVGFYRRVGYVILDDVHLWGNWADDASRTVKEVSQELSAWYEGTTEPMFIGLSDSAATARSALAHAV